MRRKVANSEWERRVGDMLTDCGRLAKSLGNAETLQKFAQHYTGVTRGYLAWFIQLHKLTGPADIEAAIDQIWAEIEAIMPAKLQERFRPDGERFRDLLIEGVHEACLSWQRLRDYRPSLPDDRGWAWLRQERDDILEQARRQLKNYQAERGKGKTPYYTVFCVWDEYGADDDGFDLENHDQLISRHARQTGGRAMNRDEFRQILKKARDNFGLYLFEEVGKILADKSPLAVEDFQHAFEVMRLTDKYAVKSVQCRCLLDLG